MPPHPHAEAALIHRALLTTLLLLCAATPLRAAEKVLHNESLEGFEGNLTGVEIVEGEIYASRFEADPGDYPIRLKSIRFVMVGNGADDARCGAFSIAVWRDGGTTDTGEPIFDTEKLGDVGAGGTVAVIKSSSSAMQELPLEGQLGDVTLAPIDIPFGAFRIGLRYAGECPAELTPAPILIHDPAGGTARHSYLYGGMPGQPREWLSTSALAMGEWVLRAVVETSGASEPADPGATSDAGAASADQGGATSDPGAEPTDHGAAGADLGPASDAAAAGDAPPSSATDAAGGGGSPDGASPKITGVEPGSVRAGEATDVSIQGSGFAAGAKVALTPGAHALAVKAAGASVIDATVPSTVPLGTYGVVVTNPDGGQAVAAGALMVVADGGGGSCAAGSGPTGGVPAMAVLLLALAVATRRRRLARLPRQ
jgi:MYXO-CTERM domain-containing protein